MGVSVFFHGANALSGSGLPFGIFISLLNDFEIMVSLSTKVVLYLFLFSSRNASFIVSFYAIVSLVPYYKLLDLPLGGRIAHENYWLRL